MEVQTATSCGLNSLTHPDPGSGFARNDRVLLVLFLAVFLSGVSWAAMVPLWQTPDEQAHFAQAQDLAAVGYRPNPGPSTSQDIVISEKLLGTFRDERGNNKFTYHPEYRLPYSNSIQGFNEEEIAKLPLQMRKVFLINEATGYPPLYYWYIALVNKLMWGQNLITRVFMSRLATVLISSIGVFAVYGLAKEVFSSRPAALAAAGLWGFMPMRQFAASGVTSDALMNSVYPLALWLFLIPVMIVVLINLLKKSLRATPMSHRGSVAIPTRLPRRPDKIGTPRNDGILGKSERVFGYIIIGIVASAVLITIMGHVRPLTIRFPRLLGYLFLPEIANFSDLYSKPTVVEYIKITAIELYRQVTPWYWGVYRWLSLTLPLWAYRVIKLALLAAAGGWGVAIIRKKQKVVRWKPAALVLISALVYAGGILVWNFFYWKSHGFSLGIQGRYFFPNMAEHMILLTGGLILAAGIRFRKSVVFLAVLGVVIFNWYSWWFVAASYFDTSSFQTFFLQMSQYKPWFFKWPFLPGVIGLGLASSGWFLWEMMRYTRTPEH